MSIFYENYLRFCNEVKKSPSAVALENGLSKTAVNGWKYERSNPTDATLQKLADYFGVTVETLTNENKPATHEGRELTEMQQKAVDMIMNMKDDQLKAFIAAAEAFLK